MVQVILLSGGSGKRLWPLSNGARSKQFLPFLSSPTDGRESMLQRVIRQINESGLECNITVAANDQQRDMLINQLGDSVNVVLEPSRRHTFPAIVLSCADLFLNKECSKDDVVVVIPCDPYTDSSYFEAIKQMANAAELGLADLIYMGVKPTEPSDKYGYIFPDKNAALLADNVLKVKSFTEKPSVSDAVRFIEDGAYWNSGAFAFRLSFIIDTVAERYMDVKDFAELRSRYSELPNISFDYEIAERTQNAAIVPFNGRWLDVGTWNILSSIMPDRTIGNVHLGNLCSNIHVINELSIPIYCDGMTDAIVAAGPDGILVSAKSTSDSVKQHVDQLVDRPMYEERRWGTYRVLDRTQGSGGMHSLTKNLFLKPGCNISYQLHHHRQEVWTFVDGIGRLRLDDQERIVRAGDVIHIQREQKHGLKAITPLTFIEVQIGTDLVEEDIVRLEMNW